MGVSAIPDATAVNRAVDRLRMEAERTGSISVDDVLRICELRDLEATQIITVRTRLVELGLLNTAKAAPVEVWRPSENVARDVFDQDGLGIYLDTISHGILYADEEIALGRRIAAGRAILCRDLGDGQREPFLRGFLNSACLLDPNETRVVEDGAEAQDQLYRSNLRLVVSVARPLFQRDPKVKPLDLCQAGNEGLLRAVQKFDHTRGFKFSTYAHWWIRQAIERYVANTSRTIRLPVHFHQDLRALRRSERLLYSDLCREPTTSELAAFLEWDEGKLAAVSDWRQGAASLDVPLPRGEGTIGTLIADEAAVSPEESAIHRAERDLVTTALGALKERDGDIIRRRFGIGCAPETLEEIGQSLGVTRERVRQIESKTLTALKGPSFGLRDLGYGAPDGDQVPVAEDIPNDPGSMDPPRSQSVTDDELPRQGEVHHDNELIGLEGPCP